MLASKVIASVLPWEQPNTRNRLLGEHQQDVKMNIKEQKYDSAKRNKCLKADLYEPVATRNPSPLKQHSNLSKIESFSYKSQSWLYSKREKSVLVVEVDGSVFLEKREGQSHLRS